MNLDGLASLEVLSRHEGEDDTAFIARLEKSARRCLAAAAGGREWPHHAAQERRTAAELMAQADRIRALKEVR